MHIHQIKCEEDMCGIAIIRADDILVDGASDFARSLITALGNFHIGELAPLSFDSPITPNGVFIEKCHKRTLLSSQKPRVAEFPKMYLGHYVRRNQIVKEDELRSTYRKGLRSIIWIRQTRPDVGYSIAKMATDIPSARKNSARCLQLARDYIKIFKFLVNHHMEIHYVPQIDSANSANAILDLAARLAIAFADA